MRKQFYFATVILLIAYLLSACGEVPQPAEQPADDQVAVKVRAVEVAFTGVVEAISGNEWTVNGLVLSVAPDVVRDGPFQAGDTIKIEGTVNADGSLTVSRVEAPSAADLVDLPQLGNDNANSNDNNSNDANGNANSNDDNSNDANTNANGNDDNTNDDSGNVNTNDDNSNDGSNNANSNDNDDDDQGNSSGNMNDDGDDSSGGNDNGDDDDNSGSGNDDSEDDD